jgi:hypothetical protein
MSADNPVGRSCCRLNSRSWRLRRFRATAERLNRGTISPTRIGAPAGCACGEAAARTSRYVVRMRFPSRAIRCSSAPRVMRACRGKPSDAWGVLCSGVLVRDTDRELLPPFLPAAGQSRAAPLRFHTRTETVRLEPSRVTRTVGWLTHGYSRYGLIRTEAQNGKVSRDREIGQGK